MARKKTLQELFQEFQYEGEFILKHSPKTLKSYKDVFTSLTKLLPTLDTGSLTPQTITTFFRILDQRQRRVGKGVTKQGVKKSTIATYWSKINCFCSWLVTRGHIQKNPFSELRYPTPNYEDKKFLKKDEVEKIIAAIFTSSHSTLIFKRNLLLVNVFLFCGLRREEALSLQLRDIDLERRSLVVRKETSKSNRTRVIPIHNNLALLYKDYLKERTSYTTQFLFVSSKRDDRLSSQGLKTVIERLVNASGVKFSAHQFRHTFAVNYLNTSSNVVKLKQLLGHTSVTMTMQYLRCLPADTLRPEVNAMSIDSFI